MPYKDREKYLAYQRKYHKDKHQELVASLPEDTTVRGTKRIRPLPKHVLLTTDIINRRGECQECGPVDIIRQGPQWKCQKANAQAYRKSILKNKYGLTEDEYDKLIKKCDGRCECCDRDFEEANLWPCIDHDHETGKVRGVLCVNCNSGIGQLGDNISGLKKALAYMERA